MLSARGLPARATLSPWGTPRVVENEIPEEELAEAFSRWLGAQMERPAVRFEKVEPGREQVLEEPAQRNLDGVPSGLDPEPND